MPALSPALPVPLPVQFKRLTEQVSRVAEQVSTLAKAANLDRLMQEGGTEGGPAAASKAGGSGAPASDEFAALNLTYIRPNIIGGARHLASPPPHLNIHTRTSFC